MQIGKPYPRRSDIELHEKTTAPRYAQERSGKPIADENYEIIARSRGKRS
jgi:hypothetical protein